MKKGFRVRVMVRVRVRVMLMFRLETKGVPVAWEAIVEDIVNNEVP